MGIEELESELSAAQQKLDRYTRLSEIGESLGGQLEEMEARIAAQQENQRLREERLQPCGHHISLLIKSVESDYQFCELCDMRDQRNDAVQMEAEYQSRLAATPTTAAQPNDYKQDAMRWRLLEHGCAEVRITPVDSAGSSFHPRDIESLVSMRTFADDAVTRHLAILRAALNPKEEHHKGGT